MKNANPKFAACQLYIRDTEEKLEDGLNRLDSVEDTFDIATDDQVILTVDMELLKKRTCSGQVDTVMVVVLVVMLMVVLVMVVVCSVIWCIRRNKEEEVENEMVDMNPEYGADYYDEKETEVKDTNEYYFYAKPEDSIEIIDTNEFYDKD